MDTLDPHRPIEVTRGRRLPHWYQPGSTHFLTTRLRDAVPERLTTRWRLDRDLWLRRHGLAPEDPAWRERFAELPESERLAFHRLFSDGFQRLLDAGHGACTLADPRAAAILASTLRHFDGQRYHLGDFVVMPNHLHVLFCPLEGHDAGTISASWKRFSATAIHRLTGQSGRFWQVESFDHLVRSQPKLRRIRRYIEENPAGLAPGTFLYHRAAG